MFNWYINFGLLWERFVKFEFRISFWIQYFETAVYSLKQINDISGEYINEVLYDLNFNSESISLEKRLQMLFSNNQITVINNSGQIHQTIVFPKEFGLQQPVIFPKKELFKEPLVFSKLNQPMPSPNFTIRMPVTIYNAYFQQIKNVVERYKLATTTYNFTTF